MHSNEDLAQPKINSFIKLKKKKPTTSDFKFWSTLGHSYQRMKTYVCIKIYAWMFIAALLITAPNCT